MDDSRATETKKIARANTREALGRSAGFHSLSIADQMAVYKKTYGEECARQAQKINGLTTQTGVAEALRKSEKASELIDEERHKNVRIEEAGELAGEFMDEVDFPGFVRDLLKGVFDANLEVTVKQMEEYQKLLKTATASVSKFVNAIDNTAAFGYLAENQGDDFNIDFSDDETEEDGTPKGILTNKDGEPVDMDDNTIKAKIMEAKIAMAKEHRTLLRETILMGITRLVVQKGVVKASVLFDIKAGEMIKKADKAAIKDSLSRSSSGRVGGGLFGSIFGGGRGGKTTSRRKTRISISSAKSTATTDLAVKLAGSVDITFKSDYFKLDNFATMYGPATQTPGAAPARPAGTPAALPAGAK